MASFLLWNVDCNPDADAFVQILVGQLQIDIVLLVEYAFGETELPKLLKKEGLDKRPSPERFGVFARGNHQLKPLRYGLGNRARAWTWVSPSGQDGLLVLLHGLDRRNYDDSTRRVMFRRVADAVRRCEGKRGNRRTVVAGDFNAQPFESAMVDADGLHAIGIKAVASKRDRKVQGAAIATDFFYNPMWRVFGHNQHDEAGAATHFWIGKNSHELCWHMVDQVVLRPEESNRFPEHRLRIVTEVGGISLLTEDGRPDRETASDHLPLAFEWNL